MDRGYPGLTARLSLAAAPDDADTNQSDAKQEQGAGLGRGRFTDEVDGHGAVSAVHAGECDEICIDEDAAVEGAAATTGGQSSYASATSAAAIATSAACAVESSTTAATKSPITVFCGYGRASSRSLK